MRFLLELYINFENLRRRENERRTDYGKENS